MQPVLTGAGKLPVQKRVSSKDGEDDDVVETVQKRGKTIFGGSSASGKQSKRTATEDAEDLRAATTEVDVETLMDKVVQTNEPMPDASASSAATPGEAILAQPAAGSAPSGSLNSAGSLDLCYLEKIPNFDDFQQALAPQAEQYVLQCFEKQKVPLTNDECRDVAALLVETGVADLLGDSKSWRNAAKASAFGLRPGVAVDLEAGWDMADEDGRRQAEAFVDLEKPTLVVASPPFGADLGRPDLSQQKATLRKSRTYISRTLHQ